MAQREPSRRANLIGRFEQTVHQAAQIAAGDVATAIAIRLQAIGLGTFQVQLGLEFPLEIAGGERGVHFGHPEVDRTGVCHRGRDERAYEEE